MNAPARSWRNVAAVALTVVAAACTSEAEPVLPSDAAIAVVEPEAVTASAYASDPAIAQLRRATARFHRLDEALAADYALIDGLDHCFTNQPVGDMGYHYIDGGRLDLEVDPLRPEAIVYAPDRQGRLRLAAVEYIVPAAAWDDENPDELPMVLGHEMHLNTTLGVYVLHAWVWQHNPRGILEDWNPTVTCPVD